MYSVNLENALTVVDVLPENTVVFLISCWITGTVFQAGPSHMGLLYLPVVLYFLIFSSCVGSAAILARLRGAAL